MPVQKDERFRQEVARVFAEKGWRFQREAARVAGLSHLTIGNMVSGQLPTPDVLLAWARGIGEDPTYWLKLAGYQLAFEPRSLEELFPSPPVAASRKRRRRESDNKAVLVAASA